MTSDGRPHSVFASRIASFRYAGRGIASLFRTEPNARIHLALAFAAVAGGFALGIERGEWLSIALATGLVFAAEAMNTAFEALCDVASPRRHPQVERAKDIAAGAVLLAACAALAVAAIVFVPRLLALAASMR